MREFLVDIASIMLEKGGTIKEMGYEMREFFKTIVQNKGA
jgi:hypothetical protein